MAWVRFAQFWFKSGAVSTWAQNVSQDVGKMNKYQVNLHFSMLGNYKLAQPTYENLESSHLTNSYVCYLAAGASLRSAIKEYRLSQASDSCSAVTNDVTNKRV